MIDRLRKPEMEMDLDSMGDEIPFEPTGTLEIPGGKGQIHAKDADPLDPSDLEMETSWDPSDWDAEINVPVMEYPEPLGLEAVTRYLTGSAGTGKCLGFGTPVMMASGDVVPVQDIKAGDLLMGPSGPRLVLSTSTGSGPLFRITPINGDPWICNDVHMMTLRRSGVDREIKDIQLNHHLHATKHHAHGRVDKVWKLMRVGVERFARKMPAGDLPIDPYLGGTWVGDGTRRYATWTFGKSKLPLVEYLTNMAPRYGCVASVRWIDRGNQFFVAYRGSAEFYKKLAENFLDSKMNRRVPDWVMYGSVEVRRAFLAGLLDTDGYAPDGTYFEIVTKYPKLGDQIMFLARSLGLAATSRIKQVKLDGWEVPRDYTRITLSGDLRGLPFLRLKPQARKQIKDVLVTGWTAEPIGHGQYYGFTLDGDGRFLLGDFTVTHNTFSTRKAIQEAKLPFRVKLAATTGIAAVNLGEDVGTIHSLLQFYNADSLELAYKTGKLGARIAKLYRRGCRLIVVDEVSMMSARMLNVLLQAFGAFNAALKIQGREEFKLMLVGDFCQLPPVPDKDKYGQSMPVGFAFEADRWEETYGQDVIKLREIRRQSDPLFIEAMNAAREGRGREAVEALKKAGVEFGPEIREFEGTTIKATNDAVDGMNQERLRKIDGPSFSIPSYRWLAPGVRAPGDWGEKIIPPAGIALKIGARVINKSNIREGGALIAANGDTGVVMGLVKGKETLGTPKNPKQHPWGEYGLGEGDMRGFPVAVTVKLDRNGALVDVVPVVRAETDPYPEEWIKKVGGIKEARKVNPRGEWGKGPWWDGDAKAWVMGQICYLPLKLGWATTCHQSQGLSLDRVQICPIEGFFGSPAMAYVALSRARTPAGLYVAATPETLEKRVKISEKVRGWL